MQLATLQAFVASAVLMLAPAVDAASLLHRNIHHSARRHTQLQHNHHHRAVESPPSPVSSVVKRGTCAFPTDDSNLFAVTPNEKNAGWAMSPDQPCQPGHYCPIACKVGMVMNQWEKGSTYSYPGSMNGGLFCDENGNIQKPFADQPNCVPGTGALKVINKCSKKISFCQTILPGNEAMLIPTVVDSVSDLAVPGASYWESTAAHYYINGPGVGPEGCIWGTEANPIGNWASYNAGANTDANGQTFVKLGINPKWQETPALFRNKPNFGVKIECPDGGCNGLPCEIKSDGTLVSNNAANGAGDASFCVVTVPKGKSANIVVSDGSGGHSAPVGNANALEASVASPQSSSTASPPPPSSTSTPSSTHSPTPTSVSKSTPSATPSSSHPPTTTTTTTTTVNTPSSTRSETPTVSPGIFHEENNSTATHTSNSTYAASPTSPQTTPTTKDKKNDAGRQQGSTAIAGLVVALVAAACFY
ncbi:sun [Cordyceps fumosorosea ARSEF 2679]|uniref:Sun n=1 Tax=Cordyceps fumosorosea (strain ARSEF 2679) TaxID=1081104 RepID=A0A167UEJ3_CORFA|nr:sun [Cordyceps fumosorosea ARSEF 2679]OAA61506.1 sun [Cordyceps fumosorosea ARSEF 2679]